MRIRSAKEDAQLKVRQTVGRAFTPDEKDRMLEEAGRPFSAYLSGVIAALTLECATRKSKR